MLRSVAAIAFALLFPASAQAQLRNCSNIYLPECSKSPFAPSGQTYGGAYPYYGYGAVPYGYYYGYAMPPYGYYAYGAPSYGYYGRRYWRPFGYYRRGPYAWRGY